jgi:hypothetical protein
MHPFIAKELDDAFNLEDALLTGLVPLIRTGGLKAFCTDFPEATPILLNRGEHRQKEGNILCPPVEEFLKNIDPENVPLPMSRNGASPGSSGSRNNYLKQISRIQNPLRVKCPIYCFHLFYNFVPIHHL